MRHQRDESTVKGGAISEMSAVKSGRLNDIAEQNRLPTMSLIECAGADLPNQSKIFVPGGRGFRDLTRRSEHRIPSICLVFGTRPRAARTSRECAITW